MADCGGATSLDRVARIGSAAGIIAFCFSVSYHDHNGKQPSVSFELRMVKRSDSVGDKAFRGQKKVLPRSVSSVIWDMGAEID